MRKIINIAGAIVGAVALAFFHSLRVEKLKHEKTTKEKEDLQKYIDDNIDGIKERERIKKDNASNSSPIGERLHSKGYFRD